MRQAFGRCVSAVGGGKCIIDEDVAVPGQRRGEVRIIGFFTFMEPGVFEQQDIAIDHCVDCLPGYLTNAVGGKMDTVIKHVFDHTGD